MKRLLLLIIAATLACSSIQAQPEADRQVRRQVLALSHFVETGSQSLNSLSSVLKKDSYRNKISSLNNPTSSELGFDLEMEIQMALKPLLEKARKTNTNKFQEVVQSLVRSPQRSGSASPTTSMMLPITGIFSSVISLVGSLTVTEKRISREDLDSFIEKTQKYFVQYELLNRINQQYTFDVQKIMLKVEDLKGDLKDLTMDCVTAWDPATGRAQLKTLGLETMISRYYDPQKLDVAFDTLSASLADGGNVPKDALTTVKLVASGIKKLQRDFDALYTENYNQIRSALSQLKSNIGNIDQKQLNKTMTELDQLYKESRQADQSSLNIALLDERLNTVVKLLSEQGKKK